MRPFLWDNEMPRPHRLTDRYDRIEAQAEQDAGGRWDVHEEPCDECYQDNQGRCHNCGALMNQDAWDAYAKTVKLLDYLGQV